MNKLHNIFLLNPYEIIKYWREFREKLETKNKEEILKEINLFWWKAPIVKFSLDYEKPETWLTPWELIFENQFDDISRAYVMAETLYMLKTNVFEESKINLMVIKDYINEEIKCILVVDNIVLNYEYNNLKNFDEIIQNSHIMIKYEKKQGKWVSV